MFKDYYSILEIPFGALQEEIKSAYKQQALRWHPDRNLSEGALKKMQDINEAYLILKDEEAKSRYDEEYKRYRKYEQSFEKSFSEENQTYSQSDKPKEEYEFHDDILKRWMNNAREQAASLVGQTLAEFKVGAKAAGKEMFERFTAYLVIGLIFSIVFALSRGCS